MSLKAIELQVAIPRTHDAGKVQEQLQQRSQVAQDLAAREMQKEVEKNEKAVNTYEQKDKLRLKKEQSPQQENSREETGSRKRNKKEEELPTQHPYKGTTIDYSG